MRFAFRSLGVGFAAALLAAAGTGPLDAETSGDYRPPCVQGLIAVQETIDSATAHAGDVFHYVLVDGVTAPDHTPIPAGTTGYGIVANSAHAERGGRGGYLALETRFMVLPDGKHVQVIIDRFNDELSTAAGSSANAPGVLGLIPIVGYAVGGYDSLHHGKDATIPRGTRIGIFLGDDAAMGICRGPHPNESPSPSASPAGSPAPSAAPTSPRPR